MQKLLDTTKTYGPFILLVAVWWSLAFKHSGNDEHTSADLFANQRQSVIEGSILRDAKLSSIDRNELKQALAGDFNLMAELIADWDIDAQILEMRHFDKIKRLPPSDYLRSQTLIRLIEKSPSKSTSITHNTLSTTYLIDDSGKRIDLTRNYSRFIPQTYAAASFLLALVPVEQIVALPPLLREQTQIHAKDLTDKVPLDIDRQNGEKLFQAMPDIAFVAHYSQPATVQALANQGITLYMMRDMTTLHAIEYELSNIGSITQRPLHADLLKLFIQAAFIAFDNRLQMIEHHYSQMNASIPKFMMLSHHQSFSVPTKKTLTGQILGRMAPFDASLNYAHANDTLSSWSVPIDKEKLLNIDPDFLIITTESADGVAREIKTDQALNKLSAVKNGRLYFVDEAIQTSPSQYAVLAYYDIIHCLERLL